MYREEKHSINSLFVEVNTNCKKTAYHLKDNLNTFLKEELFPLLETYFDTLDIRLPLQSIQIEKLNMNLSVVPNLDFEDIKREIMNQFQKQIGEQIDKGFPDTEQYRLLNKKEKNSIEFLNFLETGTSPCWLTSKSIFTTDENSEFAKMISEKTFGSKLLSVLEDRQIRNRFIKQLSDEQIYKILKQTFLLHQKEAILKSILCIKNNMNILISKSKQALNQRNLIWDIALSYFLNPTDSTIKDKLVNLIISFAAFRKYSLKVITEIIDEQIKTKSVLDILDNVVNEFILIADIPGKPNPEILQKNTNSIFFKSEVPKNSAIEASEIKNTEEVSSIYTTAEENINIENQVLTFLENEEIATDTASHYYVNNTGLILVHPFLKHLFENCGLLNKDNTINDPEVAAHLLHYIATEQEQDYENEMLFEKLLCNIPINQTINRNIILSEEHKNHANEMLLAVLDNWPVMKNSSVGLLRNEYLQRPGKIVLSGENPKVVVERKTQDILLDKISWNLGIVKLAWKNKVIFVDW